MLLFLYLLLVIAAYTAGKASRDALFLARYHAVQLPYADLAVTVLVGAVIALYFRVGRHLSMPTLQAATLLLFSASSVAFWALTHFYERPWLLPAIYIWVGVFGVLAPAQVWTLADVVMTTRQAKRTFGLIGGGAIAGWIVGGFLTTAMVDRFETEYLLLVIAVALAISAVLVMLIWREREGAAGAHASANENGVDAAALAGEAVVGLRRGLATVAASPYLRTIAIVIALSSLTTSVAAWQFKAVVQQSITEKDALARFFGLFNFYAGWAALVVAALTGPLLRRYGLGFGLFIVPAALFLGSTGLILWASLAAAVWLRASDQVLRYSIDKPTVELLYVPVSPAETFKAKSVIDTVIWRAGEGVAAGLVLLFAKLLGWTPVGISWVVVVLLFLWIAAANEVRRRYVSHLGESVARSRHDSEVLSTAQSIQADLEDGHLVARAEEDVLASLDVFARKLAGQTHPTLHALLGHPSPRVRQRAIALLTDAADRSARGIVEPLLRDPDLMVRTEALLYLTHVSAAIGGQAIDPLKLIEELGDFADFSVRSALVAFLAGEGGHQNRDAAKMILAQMAAEAGEDGRRTRLEAARLLGRLPDMFDAEFETLLADPDPDVAGAAIRSVGALQKRTYLPRLIEWLGDPGLAVASSDALAAFGPRVLGQLRDALLDPESPAAVQNEIPAVLQKIGTPEAEAILVESLSTRGSALRFAIISALNKLRQQHPFRPFDTRLVETVLAAEIRGHYRSYQILSALLRAGQSADGLPKILRDTMDREVERIFRLLHLLYPTEDLHSAYFGVQSADRTVHDNALELLENVLSPKLRDVLLPLLDSAISEEERLRSAQRVLSVDVPSFEEAVRTIDELGRFP